MSLSNKIKQQGFTIVELLIVIVVIGILAAITIVAYNGVQQRAKTTQAQTNATQAQKIAESYNAEPLVNKYPAISADFSAGPTAKLPTSLAMTKGGGLAGTTYTTAALARTATTTVTTGNGTTTLAFLLTGTAAAPTGGVILYWDYSTGVLTTNYVYYGDAAATGTTFTAPAS